MKVVFIQEAILYTLVDTNSTQPSTYALNRVTVTNLHCDSSLLKHMVSSDGFLMSRLVSSLYRFDIQGKGWHQHLCFSLAWQSQAHCCDSSMRQTSDSDLVTVCSAESPLMPWFGTSLGNVWSDVVLSLILLANVLLAHSGKVNISSIQTELRVNHN